jgi:hypothetical protein
MAILNAVGDSYNLPQYGGMIRSVANNRTPLLSLLGGMDNARIEANREFAVGQYSDVAAGSQPAITETGSQTAPAATSYSRSQDSNTTQIFQEAVAVTYRRLAQEGRLASDGVLTSGMQGLVPSELDFQVGMAMKQINQDLEYSIKLGTYNKAANAAAADKMRGIKESLTDSGLGNGDNVVDKSSAIWGIDDVNGVLESMASSGALFQNIVVLASAKNLNVFNDLYGYAPESKTEGGVAVKSIATPFTNLTLVWDQMLGDSDILFVDLSEVQLVGNVVPNKGNFFLEALAKTGASENYEIFGMAGLDYGYYGAHGLITGIAY